MHAIIGVNGVSGKTLAAALTQQNMTVRGISRSESGGDWEHIRGDARDAAAMRRATEGAEVIYLFTGLTYSIKVWRRDWPLVMRAAIEAALANGAKLVFLDNVYASGAFCGAA